MDYEFYQIIQGTNTPRVIVSAVHSSNVPKMEQLEYITVNSIFTYDYNKQFKIIKMPRLKASFILECHQTTNNKILKILLESVALRRFYTLGDFKVVPIAPEGAYHSRLKRLDTRMRYRDLDIISRQEQK